ncbi:acyltransferase [Catalinimonas sp. 4WD22]|uniref:acyltransferase n=1 Tax=Catalinimonas locisalis TaxID=3133978 RepID=UPI00310198FF
MREKQFAKRVSGSTFSKLKDFGSLLPFALYWYITRAFRQSFLRFYFHTIGKYGFRSIGRGVVIDGMPEFIWPCADITLGDFVRIGKRCVFQGAPVSKIRLGNRVTVNDGCYLTSMFSITVGQGTSIGEYTSIRDYNHKFDDTSIPIKDQDYYGSPIEIGNDCWIGRGCIILPGVSIGYGAVIGANSVVTKDIPPLSVAAGVPAKVIKMRKSDV